MLHIRQRLHYLPHKETEESSASKRMGGKKNLFAEERAISNGSWELLSFLHCSHTPGHQMHDKSGVPMQNLAQNGVCFEDDLSRRNL